MRRRCGARHKAHEFTCWRIALAREAVEKAALPLTILTHNLGAVKGLDSGDILFKLEQHANADE